MHDAMLNGFLVNQIHILVILVSSKHVQEYCYYITLLIVNCSSYVFLSTTVPAVPAGLSTLSNPVAAVSGQTTKAFDEILKATPPALLAFLANLPAIEGNVQDFHS